MILNRDDLVELTQRQKPSAQARVLEALGINYKRRPDGSLVVFIQDIHAPTQARQTAPKLRLEHRR
jgi:hypothetical protein